MDSKTKFKGIIREIKVWYNIFYKKFISNLNWLIPTIVAIISLFFILVPLIREPEISISPSLPEIDPKLHISPLTFKKGYSDESILKLFLYNSDNFFSDDAKYVNVIIKFNANLKVNYLEGDSFSWFSYDQEIFNNSFEYKLDDNILPKGFNKYIGRFEINIPEKKGKRRFVIAWGIIQGDFKPKGFLIEYDYKDQKLHTYHYKKNDINDGIKIYNEAIKN